ncbi:unnamed protein product [Ectocarpus sp. CCAP 1310/34]|nr:unnamed protein product [Ectocarpus sp. CCAP 1310/34]
MDYHVNSHDLPAWGQLEVFNSRPEAFRSLSVDEREDQRVRLLHVANNVQLKRMLVPGKEVCGPGAELYLRVAPTCPLYYMRWTNDVKQATVEFTSKVPQSGSRAEVLGPFSQVEGQAFATPVIGRVFRARSKTDPRSPLNVLPGFAVVRSQGFEVRESDSDSPPAAGRKRKRPVRATGGGRGKGRKFRNGAGGSSSDESDEAEEEEKEDEEGDEEGDDDHQGQEEGEEEDYDDEYDRDV